MALYLPPLEAAALILPVLIVQDLISLYVYRREWDPTNLKIMLPGALLGMGLAWMLAAYISDDAVRIAIGIIGIAFVANTWLQRANIEPRRMGATGGVFWGAVSGFTSFLSQAGGPPFQVYILPQRLPKLVLVGTTTIFFTIVNALKIGPYFALQRQQFCDVARIAADSDRCEFRRHLAGEAHAHRRVLQDRVWAAAGDLAIPAVARLVSAVAVSANSVPRPQPTSRNAPCELHQPPRLPLHHLRTGRSMSRRSLTCATAGNPCAAREEQSPRR